MTAGPVFETDEKRNWYYRLKMLMAMGFPLPSLQQEGILLCLVRVILVSGGEQAGKSLVAAMYLALRMMKAVADTLAWINAEAQAGRKRKPKKFLYWLVGSDYEQSRAEFRYILNGLTRVSAVNKGDVSMPLRGGWSLMAMDGQIEIVTKSAVDVRKLAQRAPDGILICEAAQVDWDVFLKCRGRVGPRRGWVLLSGTLESSTDWYSECLKKWQGPNDEGAKSFILPTWANLSLYPGGEHDPEIEELRRILPKDEFLRRFGAVASPPENLCLPEFRYDIHVPGNVAYNPDLPLRLWIDPGYSGSWYAVEMAQIIEAVDKEAEFCHTPLRHVHIVGEKYIKGAVTGLVIEECRNEEWWDNVELVVIDIAASQHAAMPSVAETWQGAGKSVVWNKVGIEDGILAHRRMLKDPATEQARIYFNETCSGVMREYGRWMRRKVTGLTNQAAQPQIVNCDALKAINYGLIDAFGYVDSDGKPSRVRDPFSALRKSVEY